MRGSSFCSIRDGLLTAIPPDLAQVAIQPHRRPICVPQGECATLRVDCTTATNKQLESLADA
jgi:hypothetical protein